MNRSQLLIAMNDCYKANLPLTILGKPGIGKTDLVEQFAKENNLGFHAFNAATMDPSSFGITIPRTDNSACDIVPTAEFTEPKEGDIFFFDELDKIDPLIQHTILPMVQNHRLHSRKLTKRWYVFAGNRTADSKSGGNYEISTILTGRGVRVEYDGPTVTEWIEYAVQRGIDFRIQAFVKKNPHYLNAYDPDADASPTHRQWVNVNKIINSGVRPLLTAGLIGAKAGADFEVFVNLTSKIPTWEQLLMMQNYTIPDDFVLRSLLAAMIGNKIDSKTAPQLKTIIDQFPAEFIMMIFQQANARPGSNIAPFMVSNGYINALHGVL